jgi:hypothetical protein
VDVVEDGAEGVAVTALRDGSPLHNSRLTSQS